MSNTNKSENTGQSNDRKSVRGLTNYKVVNPARKAAKKAIENGVLSDLKPDTKAKEANTPKQQRFIIKIVKAERVFNTSSGNVKMSFISGVNPKNTINSKISLLDKSHPMCLTKEEVKGQKIEDNIVIANPAGALDILPGGIISGLDLINSGSFRYKEMKNRKPVSLRALSNLVNKKTSQAVSSPNEDLTPKLDNAKHELTRPSNVIAMPNISSNSEVSISTMKESLNVQVGASGFFMGFAVSEEFKFSSEQYHYMYVFSLEQNCMAVSANQISSPDDVFVNKINYDTDWYYIKEVTYGRRLYVILESQYDLSKYSNKFKGSWNWGVVGAELKVNNSGTSFTSFTKLRVVSQGGQPIPVSDPKKIQSEIDRYFNRSFNQIEIVPLSFRLTTMQGKPVSLKTEPFLNGNYCLKAKKARIRLRELSCLVADDGGNNEQIYGGVTLWLWDDKLKPVPIKGKKQPFVKIVYANRASPIILYEGQPITDKNPTLKDMYLDVPIQNLDYVITIIPDMKEKDDFGDDVFKTNNKFSMSIRKMLWEGESLKTFEFRHDKSIVHLTVSVEPI